MGKQAKGVVKQRPGNKAGEPCEARAASAKLKLKLGNCDSISETLPSWLWLA